MPVLHWLDHLDKILFIIIHNDADQKLLDDILPLLRNPTTWIPLYVFMFYYFLQKMGSKVWLFVLFTLILIALTDSFAAQILKPFFERLRPCHDPELQPFLRNIVECGGMYSMPSNHAANHFALATFWYWSVFLLSGKKWKWLWVWAVLICYAQVYVGKHYPSDILMGAILGFITGNVMAKIFERMTKISNKNISLIIPKVI
jgi:membrane-associated phospholipid phosphatase